VSRRGPVAASGGPAGANTVTNLGLDYEFVPQYNIKVIAGRNFDRQFPHDNKTIMINRSLSKELEFVEPKQAIGEKLISGGGDTLTVVGVLEDFHEMSLKTAIIPVVYRLMSAAQFYSIKLETTNYKTVIDAIEGPWKTIFPGNPIDYFFLDQFFNKQYEKDEKEAQAAKVVEVGALAPRLSGCRIRPARSSIRACRYRRSRSRATSSIRSPASPTRVIRGMWLGRPKRF